VPDGLLRAIAVAHRGGPQGRRCEHAAIPANMEEMVLTLPNWEKRVWRECQGRIHAIDRSLSFAEFMDDW